MTAVDPTARPVSGEIMTNPAMVPERVMRGPADDIIEADYEVLPRAAPGVDLSPPLSRAIETPSIEGMDMLRNAEAAERPLARGGPIFWVAGLGAALAAFWISGGHALVRHAPFWPAQQPAVALSISGVTSRVDASGPDPFLLVTAEATNEGTKVAQLPPLEIHVTGNDGRITRYTLGTSSRPLAPGERFGFSSRLDVPGNGVKTVSVTFAS